MAFSIYMCLIYFRVSTKMNTYTHECRDILEMGTRVSYAVSCIFYVSIVLLHILIINSKAELPTAYFKGRGYTWKEARNSCKLIELSEKIQVSNNIHGQYGHYGWVDASVEYTPWVEYKKCYLVKQENIVNTTVIRHENLLQDCLLFCQAYVYIGLQQASCVCLNVNETDIERAGSICKQSAIEQCKKDKFLFCANAIISPQGFIIYKKGTITKQLGPGNCLGVFSSDGRSHHFQAKQCKNNFNALYTKGTIRQAIKSDWIHSTKACYPYNPISYKAYKQINQVYPGDFWLANIRRPRIRNVIDLNQTYCIAVTIGKTNHKVTWLVRPCTEKLPALCDGTDVTSPKEKASTIMTTTFYETLSTITVKISTGPEKKGNRTNEILMIALIITAVLALAVIIAVIIFYKRRNSLRSRHLLLVVPNNEVTYAQVNKPTQEKAPVNAGEPTGNNTTDDTYDHMEHHRVSQNQIPTESNYDTMQSVGNEELENDYDVTSGTDRPRQIVVDNSAEYSHMEGEVGYQETKDVST